MSSTEISLLGRFPSAVYEQILSRLSNAAHDAQAFESTEQVYERGISGNALDENLLRLRAIRRAGNHRTRSWSIEILLKPETARFSSEMLLRRTIVVDLKTEEAERGDSARLINSLGYSWKFVLVRRGVELRRGGVIVLIYQLYKSEETPTPLDPSSYLISISTTTSDPARSKIVPASTAGGGNGGAGGGSTGVSGEGEDIDGNRQRAMGRIREVKDLLVGLVDLARVE